MQNTGIVSQQEVSTEKSTRLHYLDWLQVLAILGVFLYHSISPFDDISSWHIKNVERSALLSFLIYFFTWGMPFFFMMAGATSWFSLQRRSPGRYIKERVTRLLIPFILGSIVLTPIQAFYDFSNKDWWHHGSIIKFIFNSEARAFFYTEYRPIVFSPAIFGVGFHLWFLAGLFAFALLALPLFLWLKRDPGKQFTVMLARPADWRGGLLAYAILPILARFVLQPGFSYWADSLFYLLFFVSGHIFMTDERFMGAIRRDWLLYLILSIATTLFFFSSAAGVPVFDWLESPDTPAFYIFWAVFGINSWCWSMVMLTVGMRFLDFSNGWLRYAREASFAFFFIHHPVIIFIAFYVVQWEVSLLIKLLVVLIGSFAITVGLYELLVRRIHSVRAVFGMGPKKKRVSSFPEEATA